MSIETKIADAIADLRTAIYDGDTYAVARDEIAAEYGITPAALDVRFERQHGDHATLIERETAAIAARERAADMDNARCEAERERELIERRAIAEFFATRSHGMGRAVTAAANDYLRSVGA